MEDYLNSLPMGIKQIAKLLTGQYSPLKSPVGRSFTNSLNMKLSPQDRQQAAQEYISAVKQNPLSDPMSQMGSRMVGNLTAVRGMPIPAIKTARSEYLNLYQLKRQYAETIKKLSKLKDPQSQSMAAKATEELKSLNDEISRLGFNPNTGKQITQPKGVGEIPKGTIGQIQQQYQATDLTKYEDAINKGNKALAEQIGKLHLGDARFQLHLQPWFK